MSDYDVSLINDSMQEFFVKFKGPEDSKYCHSLNYQETTNINK